MIKPSTNQTEVFQTFTIAIQKQEKVAIQSDGTWQTENLKKLQSVSDILDNKRRELKNVNPTDPLNIEGKHIGILEKARLSRNHMIPRGEQ